MKVNVRIAKLRLAKASPAILLGVGIVSTVAGVIAACRQTTKIDRVLDKHNDMMDEVRPEIEQVNPVEEETETTAKSVRVKTAAVYAKTGVNFVKLYAPAAGLVLLGMGSFLVSHRILNKRYLGAVAAYTGISNAFERYRRNVIEDQGVDKDSEYRLGKGTKKKIDVKTVDDDGNEVVAKRQAVIFDEKTGEPIELSEYTIVFARWTSDQWDENEYYNRSFIAGQEDVLDLMVQDKKVGLCTFNQICAAFRVKQSDNGLYVGYPKGTHVKFRTHERWIPSDDGVNYEPIYYIEPIGMKVLINNVDNLLDGV